MVLSTTPAAAPASSAPNRGDPIAIVVVTRNRRAELEETVQSVLALDDARVTLYIVDGASTDGTVDYLRTLPSPLVTWTSERDRGIYDAMNKGWRMVPEDHYILYMGAGDKPLSLPDATSLATAAAQGQKVVIGVCDIGELQFRSRWNADLAFSNTAHHQALMVHKSLHPSPPFDATLKVYADWDFNARLFHSGHSAFLDERFRSFATPGGVSAEINLGEVWRVCFRHAGFIGALRALRFNARAKRAHAKRRSA